jgi:hypothetical protein
VFSEDSRVLPQKNRSGSAKAIEGDPQAIGLPERAGVADEMQAYQDYENAKVLQSHLFRFPQ